MRHQDGGRIVGNLGKRPGKVVRAAELSVSRQPVCDHAVGAGKPERRRAFDLCRAVLVERDARFRECGFHQFGVGPPIVVAHDRVHAERRAEF